MKDRIIRASSTPRVMGCNASSHLPDIEINTKSEPSIMGDCVHEVLAKSILEGGECITKDIYEIASKHNVCDFKELRILAHVGLNAFNYNIKPHIDISTLEIEEDVSFVAWDSGKDEPRILVPSHLDIGGVSPDGNTLLIADFKSGRKESDYKYQLKTYGYGMLSKVTDRYPDIKKIVTAIIWLRSGTIEIDVYSLDDILKVPLEIKAADESNVYSPSPDNCFYCPNYDCEAKRAMSKDTINSLVTLSQQDASLSKTMQLSKLYPKIQFVEQQAKKAKELIKEHVRVTGQRIPLDNGKFLGIREENRDEIDLAKGAATINGFLSDDLVMTVDRFAEMISPIVKVSKTNLLDAVAARSAKGEKGRDKVRIVAQLEEYGAISKTTIEKLNMFSEGEPNE